MRVTNYNELLWSTPATEKTVYNSFAASKLKEPKSGSVAIEVTLADGSKIIERYKNMAQMTRVRNSRLKIA